MRVLFYYNGGESLSIEYLSAYLKSKGHIIDLLFDPGLGSNFYLNIPILNRIVNDRMIIKKAKRFKPDLIAFSCVTNQYLMIKKIARKLKALLKVPIIIGGVHPTSVPEEVIKEECFDILCISEGEEAFAELLEKMEKKDSILKIKNLWVKDKDKKVHRNKLRPLIKDLDKLPFADKSLFHKYGALTSRLMVMTGRGCPFQCTFCINNLRKTLYREENYYRKRSVDNIIEELIRLKKKYKPKGFRFEDDSFSNDLDWLKEFRIEYKRHINLPFHCYVTSVTATDEVLKELKLAGCISVSMGIQSSNETIRRELLKRFDSNKIIIEAAKRIKEYRIKLISEFIFGLPYETPKDMWNAFELNEKLNAYATASFIFYPFPRTELADYCLKNGFLKIENYEKIIKKGIGSYHQTCLLEHPYKNEVFRYYSIMPLYNKAPRFIKIFLKRLLKVKYGLIHKLIYAISIPLIDFDEFLIRIVQYPKMIIKTRRVLKKA